MPAGAIVRPPAAPQDAAPAADRPEGAGTSASASTAAPTGLAPPALAAQPGAAASSRRERGHRAPREGRRDVGDGPPGDRGARTSRRASTCAASLAFAAVALLAPTDADATEIKVSSRTYGEGYMVRVPNSTDLLSRRRLVQYVNLGVYELLPPKRPTDAHRAFEEGQLHLVTSMRLRHDFGTYLRDGQDPAGQALRSMDGRQVDVLFAYLEGQNLGGFVDVRAGRQFEMSGLDFYAFDGAWSKIHLPVIPLAVEAFGGMMVDGSQLFGFPTFETDGTNGTPRDRAFSPMAGAGISIDRIRWLDARAAYRRTWTPHALNQGTIDDDGAQGLASAVDQEIVSFSAAARLAKGTINPFTALRYNLGTARLDDVSAGLHLAMGPRQAVRAFYIRTIPAFDLDSIFNTFTNEAFEDIRVVFESRPSDRWILAARSQTRIFRDALTSDLMTPPSRATRLGVGGGATAAYRIPRFALRFDGYALGGEGGLRAGGSVDTRTMVAWNRLAIDGRVYGLYYRDEVLDARRGYSLAFQAGLNVQLWRGIHMSLLGEELITNYYTSALRLLASLSVDWSLRASRQR